VLSGKFGFYFNEKSLNGFNKKIRMATLYIEAFSGLSGDMFLGALAGLSDSYEELGNLPKLLALDDAKIEISRVDKNGIVCKHVKVIDLNQPHAHHEDNHHHNHDNNDHNHHHHHGHDHHHDQDHSKEHHHPHGH